MFKLLFFVFFALVLAKIDPKSVSVSGLSAGGFMASQYGTIHSKDIVGVGILAGGPYYCALSNMITATTACMSTPMLILPEELYAEADSNAQSGLIDPLDNLRKQRIYLFSGTEDMTVMKGVVEKAQEFYQHYQVQGIATKFDLNAGHTLPTDNFGNECELSLTPWIGRCQWSAAGAVLTHIYGNIKAPKPLIGTNLMRFDQNKYGGSEALLAPEGFYYVPASCKTQTCRLHVVFHGCNQGYEELMSNDFVNNTQYNEYAESNNLVILYPQAHASMMNPQGCFDWWGYSTMSEHTYATNTGPQILAIEKMIKQLLKEGRL